MWIFIGVVIILLWLIFTPAQRKDEIKFIKDFFTKSYVRWVVFILLLEFLIAISLSPTVLSGYPLFNWLATSPDAIHFYLILTVLLILPKVIISYYVIEGNPLTVKSALIISLNSSKIYPSYLSTVYGKGWGLSEEKTQQISAEFDPDMREEQIQKDINELEVFIDKMVEKNTSPTQEELDENKVKLEKFQAAMIEDRIKRQQEVQQLIAKYLIPERTLKKIANPGKRSMPSRVFWSLAILLFTTLLILFYIDTMPQYLFASKEFYIELNQLTLDHDRSLQSAFFGTSMFGSFAALMLAISILSIKDSILYFKENN